MLLFKLLFLFLFNAGTTRCDLVKTGRFKLVNEKTGISLITRTANRQIEIVEAIDLKLEYRVKWLNDCTYQLFDGKVVKGNKIFQGRQTDTITVNIINVAKTSYQVITSSNFSDLKVQDTVQIMQ